MHKRLDIVLVVLDPAKGHEQKGRRPCLILQNDLISRHLGLYLVAPITTNCVEVPTGLILENWKAYGLENKSKVLFHQIRVIDGSRALHRI